MKEEEIAGLLSQGIAPAELVRKGYARGIVYKVRGRLEQPGTAQEKGDTTVVTDSGLDPALEADPEIMELKKALRKVELERQIEEIRGPSSAESRLLALEENAETLEAALAEVIVDNHSLKQRVDGSPLSGLRELFECSCGAGGMVAARVVCTSCSRETSHGWWPKNS